MSDPTEPIDWDEEEDDAIDVPTHCASCGKPATGFAMINDQRFCHPDDGPSCYMGGQR